MLTEPKNSSEMSEIQWPHTLHLSQNPEKAVCSGFQIGGSVCPVTTIIQIPYIPVSKSDVLVSTG
jgi:hypothetical protein